MKNELLDFILRHQEDLLRFCFFLTRDQVQASDLAQETFVRILSSKLPETNVQNHKAFVFQSAKNLFLDQKRKQKQQKLFSQIPQQSSMAPPDIEVWQALFALDQNDQEVLLLVDREGLSLIEAAEFLKISESALKSRLFRARENFKKIWDCKNPF